MTTPNWSSLKTPEAWSDVLNSLGQDAQQAKTGIPADRQAVEANLEMFWKIPCPFANMILQATNIYDSLVNIDLNLVITQTNFAQSNLLQMASTDQSLRKGVLTKEEIGQHLLQELTTLQTHHREHLAAHLAVARQIDALKETVQKLFPGGSPSSGGRLARLSSRPRKDSNASSSPPK